MVATDGNRLMLRRLSVALPPEVRAIVPLRGCEELPALLRGAAAAAVQIRLARSWIEFACGDWTYRSKLIDGEYPSYRRVLPQRVPHPTVVNRVLLAESVARVRQVARNLNHNALVLAADGGELTIAAGDEGGAGEDGAPVLHGAGFGRVGLRNTYLAEALAALPGVDEIELHVRSPDAPVWICPAGEQCDGILVMPMRV
jgi:DNA polymerase III subunit beta